MLEISVICRGTSPLMMNPLSKEVVLGIRSKTSSPQRTDWTPEEEAESKILRNGEGQIGLPSKYLYSCLIEAGRKVKNGKDQVSTLTSTTLPSFLRIKERFLVFTNNPRWEADIDAGRNEKKQVICIVRPRFEEWVFGLTLLHDETEANPDVSKKLVEIAGKRIGVGAYRPACRGDCGLFEISSWVLPNGQASQNGHAALSSDELAAATA